MAVENGYGEDIEFLLAALLHDIGKVKGSKNHAETGAMMVTDLVSERTEFLIAHHMDLFEKEKGEFGKKRFQKIEKSGCLGDLLALRNFDDMGRRYEGFHPTVEEALEYLRAVELRKNQRT